MDIEGTTSSISFVRETLSQYSKDNLINFLECEFSNKANNEIQEALKEISKIGLDERLYTGAFNQEIALRVLLHLINNNNEAKGLKTIQHFQWKAAYQSKKLVGHVYPDVPECLQEWKEQKIKLGLCSSDSTSKNHLLFSHTKYGNLQELFDFNFEIIDSSRESIQKDVGYSVDKILFLSTNPSRLESAKKLGLNVIQVTRNGTLHDQRFLAIRDFTEVEDVLQNAYSEGKT